LALQHLSAYTGQKYLYIRYSFFMTRVVSTKASRREWIGLSILILPTLIVSMDMTVTYLALPVLSAALKPSSAGLLWITDIYGFMQAGLLIVMGAWGDRIGLRKTLLTGATAFSAASVLAAFSPSAFWLIIARAVMGIGGATILPTVISLIRNMFADDSERTFAMGLYTTCFSTGCMLGPIFGGFLLSHFWWGSIFLMPVPLILLLLFIAPFMLPEYKHAATKKPDFADSALLISATLPFVYGVKQIAQNGITLPSALCIAAGLCLAVIFIRRQKKLTDPLIDLQLFKLAKFNIALGALFIALFSWAGIFLFVGQYMQSVLGLSSLAAGLWMLPGALGSVILCMLAPVVVRYFSRGRAIAAGLLILAAGTCLVAFLTVNSLSLIVIAGFLMSGGCGLTVTLGIDTVVSSAPPQKAGAAAGISETSTGFGSSFGIAILGSIWTAFYRGSMPNSTPADARNTIGGAVAEAGKLKSAELLNHAREAFIYSLHITAVVCTVIILATAALVAVKFKK
jgi:DHA2 family multidrug resistance protein-like MFS transporter